jgi:lipoate-protein ligase A
MSLIVNQPALPHVPSFPKSVMTWSGMMYAQALGNAFVAPLATTGSEPVAVGDNQFALWDNDYCIGTRKFGGNAQCFTRQRWLHHVRVLQHRSTFCSSSH